MKWQWALSSIVWNVLLYTVTKRFLKIILVFVHNHMQRENPLPYPEMSLINPIKCEIRPRPVNGTTTDYIQWYLDESSTQKNYNHKRQYCNIICTKLEWTVFYYSQQGTVLVGTSNNVPFIRWYILKEIQFSLILL